MPVYVPLIFTRDGQQRASTNPVEEVELRFDGWTLIGVDPSPTLTVDEQIAALTARVVVLEGGGAPDLPVFSISPITGHVLAAMPGGAVIDLNGEDAYEAAVAAGFVGTEAAWLLSLRGTDGDPLEAGGFTGPTITNDYLSVQIRSRWGRNVDSSPFYAALGATPSLAAILMLLDNGDLGLRQIGDRDTTGGTVTTDRGLWSSAASYIRGDVVSHSPTCARWSCAVGNLNSVPSLTNPNWIHVGLWAIRSDTDPGGGVGWIALS